MLSFNEQEKEAAVRFCVTALFVTIQFLETKKNPRFSFFPVSGSSNGKGVCKGFKEQGYRKFQFQEAL